jgi:putative transcriptional regulator
MLILLDHNTPTPFRYALRGHVVVEAFERGWERLVNGILLDTAEAAGFELFVTADKNIRYQQNLSSRKRSGLSCADTLKGWSLPWTQPRRAATARWTCLSSEALPCFYSALREGGETRMNKRYRSDAMAAVHETTETLHDVGAVDKQTMRRFDDACLTPIRPLKPREIKAIREREQVSQTVFATYLNVTSSLVSKWERGEKRPSRASLKLLSLVEKKGLATVA